MILAIDPGPTQSAYMLFDDAPRAFGKIDNEDLVESLGGGCNPLVQVRKSTVLVVEFVESFGMPVGKEVFETCFWAGRFCEAWGNVWELIYRKDVKLHLCQNLRAKDANIRQALIDKFGGERAVGKKKSPGPLYGISGDVWSALAVAVTYAELFA